MEGTKLPTTYLLLTAYVTLTTNSSSDVDIITSAVNCETKDCGRTLVL